MGILKERRQNSIPTIASCLPMLPIVTPPEKNIDGSHDRKNIRSGFEYLEISIFCHELLQGIKHQT